ncbi:diguanylate cyclase [Paenibacillus sp. CC-CFT747]|nr:diguanylate cyclase [Paenibacillus sp. CC-CFT747]
MVDQPVAIAFLLYLLPSFFLLYIASEIYTRNRQGRVNRTGAFFVLCFCVFFLTLFLAAVSPEDTAEGLYRTFLIPSLFLAVGVGMKFFLYLGKMSLPVPRTVLPLLYYGPSLAMLAIDWSSGAFLRDLKKTGIWIKPEYGPLFPYALSFLILYTSLQLLMIVAGMRRSGDKQRGYYRILLAASFFSLLWGFSVAVAGRFFPGLLEGVELSGHSFIGWAFAVHLIMAKHEFLPFETKKYERLFQLSPFAIVLLNEQAGIVEMNPAAKRMADSFGGTDGEKVLDPLFPRLQEEVLDKLRQSFQSRETEDNLEVIVACRPGRPVTLKVDSAYIEADEEVFKYYVVRDVTKEKELERQRAESERRYRETAERLEVVSVTSNDGVWDVDLIRQQVFLTGRLFHQLGLVDREHPIAFCAKLIHGEDLPRIHRTAWEQMGEDQPISLEFRIRKQEGGYAWVSITGRGIAGDGGRTVRLIGSIKDISERKQAEEQIRHLAYHDTLTGLPNRALFHKEMNGALETARREGRVMALMLLDLDRFKIINDSLGHGAGDELLKHVAHVLESRIGPAGTVARLGETNSSSCFPG